MWGVAVAILLLMLCIEALVDRHYGLAVIFVTPLTIFIAEYGSTVSLAQFGVQEVIRVRMLDTTIGCMVGLSGGLVIHSAKLRAPLQRFEEWLLIRLA